MSRAAAFIGVCLLPAAMLACDAHFLNDYTPVTSIEDEATGLFVELGTLIGISSYCFTVNVFSDRKSERSSFALPENLPLVACNVSPEEPTLTYEDGCYVLRIDARSGGPSKASWVDPNSGHEICLRMIPFGSKGG